MFSTLPSISDAAGYNPPLTGSTCSFVFSIYSSSSDSCNVTVSQGEAIVVTIGCVVGGNVGYCWNGYSVSDSFSNTFTQGMLTGNGAPGTGVAISSAYSSKLGGTDGVSVAGGCGGCSGSFYVNVVVLNQAIGSLDSNSCANQGTSTQSTNGCSFSYTNGLMVTGLAIASPGITTYDGCNQLVGSTSQITSAFCITTPYSGDMPFTLSTSQFWTDATVVYYAVNRNNGWVPIDVIAWNAPDSSGLLNGFMFLLLVLFPVGILLEFARKYERTEGIMLFILLGLLLGSMLGIIANVVPVSALFLFGGIFVLYVWKGQSERG